MAPARIPLVRWAQAMMRSTTNSARTSFRSADAVRADAGQLQDLRHLDPKGRHSRAVGRRHRSDHLRRASNRLPGRTDARRIFPHQITREFTFLPYAQISEFALDDRLARHRSVLRSARAEARSLVAFVVDVTLHNPGRESGPSSVFPWALLIGQRFYGEPEKAVRASVDDRFIRSVNEETGAVRWWGGSREPDAVGRRAARASAACRRCARDAWSEREHLDEVTPQLAEFVSRRIFGALEYGIDVAPGARESLRMAVVFHRKGDARARPALEQLLGDATALHETQRYYAESSRRRALDDALARDQPRRRVGQSQHAARSSRSIRRAGGRPTRRRPTSSFRATPRGSCTATTISCRSFQPRRDRAVQQVSRTERPSRRVRARRQRLQDVVRAEHQRRHAAAPDRDPAPLQRDARRRVAAHRSTR